MTEIEVKEDILKWLKEMYPQMYQKFIHMEFHARKVFLKKSILFRISVEPVYLFELPIKTLYKINEMVENNPELLKEEFCKKFQFEEYKTGDDEKIDKLINVIVSDKSEIRRFPLEIK